MQEKRGMDNKLGLKVIINDVPNLKSISKERADSILKALEIEISLKTRPNAIDLSSF